MSHRLMRYSFYGLLCSGLWLASSLIWAGEETPEASETEQEAESLGQILGEIVVTAPKKEVRIKLGWEPSSADAVDEQIEGAYARLSKLNELADACDIDSVMFVQNYIRRRPCEKFLEEYQANFVNYRNTCYVLVQWYRRFTEEVQAVEDVETDYRGTLLWMMQTKENLEITCNMTRVRRTMPAFDLAINEIERIARFVSADQSGAPTLLER